MAHNIHKDKVLSLRMPMWHGLGQVIDEEITAVEAGQRIGVPEVFTEGIQLRESARAHQVYVPDYKAICGKDPKDGSLQVYSIVSQEYEEVTHHDFLEMFDRATKNHHIETIGCLGDGNTLFVTATLPPIDVKGEYLEEYLMATNSLDGKTANRGNVSHVRTVCQNTLNAALSRSLNSFKVSHYKRQVAELERWLTELWESAKFQSEALQEAYTILMERPVTVEETNEILEKVYPLRKPIDENDYFLNLRLKGRSLEQAQERAEKHEARQLKHRDGVLGLFEGSGQGSTLPTAQGTAWGVYNAVVEYEDYLRPRRNAASAMFGAGQERIQVAFDECLVLTK